MTISVYMVLQRKVDDAIKAGDVEAMFSASMSLNGYLVAELDRIERDRDMLMDMIREYRLRIDALEDQA